MRILLVSQYFYPENFRINDLATTLQKKGHHVEVLTGKPNYPEGKFFKGYSWRKSKIENFEGVRVHRANLIPRAKGSGIRLFLNYSSFIFFGFFKLLKLKGEFEKVFIYAPSPITVGILGVLAAHKYKCKSYLWVHDLWPESVRVAGGISNKFILNAINLMTKIIYKYTTLILVQSPRFKDYIKKQNVDKRKLIYYPYYAEDFYKVTIPKNSFKNKFPQGFNLLFAGNIGVAQSFDTILSAFELLKNYKINLIILGEGRDKERILKKIHDKGLTNKFHFFGKFPPEQMPKFFTCADALMISLKKAEILSYTIPAKLQSYLACGKPIIGSLDGIGNKIIKDSRSGYASSAENSTLLAKNIIKIYNDTEASKKEFSRNAISYFNTNFKKSKLIKRLEHILEDY